MKTILFACLLCATPALAADPPMLKLEPGACDMLVKHVPSPDVDYQPGLDAYGRQVAPAGVPAPNIALAPIEIPLSVNLADRLKLPGGTTTTSGGSQIGPGGALGRYGNEGYVGTVTVLGDTVVLNGEPITDEAEANLAVLCMRANPPNAQSNTQSNTQAH